MRRLKLKSGVWTYTVGKQYVVIHSPEGKRTNVHAGDVNGCDFERGQWKRTTDGMVTPSNIRTYIEAKLEKR